MHPRRTVMLYHGTTAARVPSIAAHGMRDPFLTSDPTIAAFYAEGIAASEDSAPAVLQVRVPVTALRYDSFAMQFPIHPDPATTMLLLDRARRVAAQFGDASNVDPYCFEVSLDTVSSVRVDGVVPPGAIRVCQIVEARGAEESDDAEA